jgi:hypothetical protein
MKTRFSAAYRAADAVHQFIAQTEKDRLAMSGLVPLCDAAVAAAVETIPAGEASELRNLGDVLNSYSDLEASASALILKAADDWLARRKGRTMKFLAARSDDRATRLRYRLECRRQAADTIMRRQEHIVTQAAP